MGKTSLVYARWKGVRVHPHACGENISVYLFRFIIDYGPPPRVWGKLPCLEVAKMQKRSTPTRVGKTQGGSTHGRHEKVHPHACGENFVSVAAGMGTFGPPPRVWGKRVQVCSATISVPSTPTRVGKTERPHVCEKVTMVHPHACGENVVDRGGEKREIGPPPRVWGKPSTDPAPAPSFRSTPTRVGKTLRKRVRIYRDKVHPHACGENWVSSAAITTNIGPPPRVWGKLCDVFTIICTQRSTPTRVGKTHLPQYSSIFTPVHPHACGENGRETQSSVDPVGPPPRVWGKRVIADIVCRDILVHPHACGENKTPLLPYACTSGPPPRVWGKRRR